VADFKDVELRIRGAKSGGNGQPSIHDVEGRVPGPGGKSVGRAPVVIAFAAVGRQRLVRLDAGEVGAAAPDRAPEMASRGSEIEQPPSGRKLQDPLAQQRVRRAGDFLPGVAFARHSVTLRPESMA